MINKNEQLAIEAGILEALTHWNDDDRVERALGFLRMVSKAGRDGAITPVRMLLKNKVKELSKQDIEVSQALQMRYWQGEVLQAVAQALNVSIATAKRKCDHGVLRLTEMITRSEANCRARLVEYNLATLPPPSYGNLFGQAGTLDLLEEQILAEGAPWIIALIGLGGTGKSAVTDALVRRLLPKLRFERVIWLRSDTHEGANDSPAVAIVDRLATDLAAQILGEERQQKWSDVDQSRAVWQTLKGKPHLIVIDNLENDSETLVLMELLSGLANPTKFLVTTRSYQINQAGVYHVTLGDLSREAARDLLIEQLRISGPSGPPADPIEQEKLVDAIFETVGGHPLAIKLIARMLDVQPLEAILDDFREGHSFSREDVYDPIFERAWQIISPEARQLWVIIGASGNQAVDIQALLPHMELTDDQVWRAIRELTRRSLIEPRGSLTHKRYGTHRLTQRFLAARTAVTRSNAVNPG